MNEISKLEIHDRQICIFANDETKEKLKIIDWKAIGLDSIKLGLTGPISDIYKDGARFIKKVYNFKKNYKKHSKLPILDIDEARITFRFPPSHPKNGLPYATSEIERDLYIPLASFHTYMYNSKMSAFVELCASLGAKSCKVLYAEENDKDVTLKFNLQKIQTKLGVIDSETNYNTNTKKSEKLDVLYTFPPYKKMINYETNWMNGEPTWQTLQKLRLENGVECYRAEFNYLDDFGVNASIVKSLNGVGVNIGGSFQEFKKIKFQFEVEFWPTK